MEHISDSQKELRRDILDYAWTEFIRLGLKKVKVDDISSHFSISKRTLYEMFEDKETLIVECFRHRFDAKHKEVELIHRETTLSLETYVRLFAERIKESENINPVFFSEAFKYPKLMRFFEETTEERNSRAMEVIQKCVNDGYLIPDFNYPMLLEAYGAQFMSIVKLELYKKYKLSDMLNTLQIISFRGCCTEKGLELLQQKGYMCKIDKVIGVQIPDDVGSLTKLLTDVESININIEYLYVSYSRDSKTPLAVMKAAGYAEIEASLKSKGYTIV